MLKKIILIGGGGHCKSCIDIIEKTKKFRITGIIDNNKKKEILNYKIIGNDSDLNSLRKKFSYAFITLGQIKDYKKKLNLYKKIKKLKFKIPKILSPNSIVSKYSIIGEGTIIMQKCIIGQDVQIGENCIINNNALIEHDSIIKNNCHISTGAIINGNVIIGKNSFIGSGVVIKNNITIGENVIIGASTYVNKDIKDNSLIK